MMVSFYAIHDSRRYTIPRIADPLCLLMFVQVVDSTFPYMSLSSSQLTRVVADQVPSSHERETLEQAQVGELGARRVRPAAETEGWLNGAVTGPRRGARSASVALSRAAIGAGGAEALVVGGAPLERVLTGG